MNDLKGLYQDLIIDHNRSPRNFRRIDPPDREAQGFNPLCGDKLTVYLKMDGEKISDVSFEGSGCAISIASASLMTDSLKGKSEDEARALFKRMHALLTDSGEDAAGEQAALGKLEALGGVKAYPTRVKCATLCWHALTAALNQVDTVSTE